MSIIYTIAKMYKNYQYYTRAARDEAANHVALQMDPSAAFPPFQVSWQLQFAEPPPRSPP